MRVGCIVTIMTTIVLGGCAFNAGPEDVGDTIRGEQIITAGVGLLRAGDLEQADAHFELAHEIAPSAASLDGRGCVSLLRGDIVQAEQFFLGALEQDPQYAGAMGNLGLLYELAGRKAEAMVLYREALKRAPHNPALRNNFAAALADDSGEQKTVTRSWAMREMRKAAALALHPIIVGNLKQLEEQ